jgi:ABC-type transport system involved in multi-copper enzyme maturation permease subunit
LIFTRPISRSQYIISKWITLALIGGGFSALQNLVIAAIGLGCGESITGPAVLSMVLERFLDAALLSAAMILTMLARNPAFQIVAILAFYVWLAGQTIPPVSIATGGSGIQDLSIEATKLMLSLSQTAGQAVLPTLNIYDLFSAPLTALSPVLAYLSMLTLYLVAAIEVTNRREFFYGTN